MTLHTKNKDVVREFAIRKPVSRILVNTPGALGGVGASTGLAPALTLGAEQSAEVQLPITSPR